jgi:hypothetical protein
MPKPRSGDMNVASTSMSPLRGLFVKAQTVPWVFTHG